MKKSLLIILLAVAFVFSSCNYLGNLQIEKRHYSKGYYVHYSGNRSDNAAVSVNDETIAAVNENAAASKPEIVNEEKQEATQSHSSILPVKKESAASNKKNKPELLKKDNGVEKNRPVISKLKQLTQPKESSPAASEDLGLLLMVILAIFLSPIAVYLKEGITNRFWLDLICWLLGGGLIFSPFFYGGALLLFAIVFALLIVFDVI